MTSGASLDHAGFTAVWDFCFNKFNYRIPLSTGSDHCDSSYWLVVSNERKVIYFRRRRSTNAVPSELFLYLALNQK